MQKQKRPQDKGLKILIVGCGKVGETLVEQLIKEGHDITVIDKRASKIQEITNLHDVMGLVGNGASYSVQMEAGIENTDLIIAVTDSDELNLLCCTVAKRVGDCSAIARVRTPDYSREAGYLREKLGLAMIINPELETAREAAKILYLPSALEVNSFAHGQAEIVKFQVPEYNIIDGMTVMDFSRELHNKILICAIERNGIVHIPSGASVIHSGDKISFIASRKSARLFFEEIGYRKSQVKDTLIVGGGKASFYLAKQLLGSGISVKIIEQNRERCEELSIMLPKAIIINGDGTDEETLKEVGIEQVDSFVPLTGIDEENIILTLYAKKTSKAKVITKINRNSFKEVISQLDLGSVIYPKFVTSEAIIAYVRAKKNSMNSNIETLYHMFDSQVEAIEFRVEAKSELTNIPLAELSLKKELLVACISRKGQIIIPSGNDCIKPQDTVIIVTTHTGFHDITDILSDRRNS